MVTFVSYLCARLLESSDEIRATMRIQAWYRRLYFRRHATQQLRDAVVVMQGGLEERLRADGPKQEQESIEQMKSRGLTVVELDDALKASFREVADQMTASWRGTMIPADIYDLAVRERDAFRASR